jgi:hypothetical protein
MRVLIVEDEPFMAEAIRDGLRLEAIAADIAGDGDTAERRPADVIGRFATYRKHVNGHVAFADDKLLAAPEASDITDALRDCSTTLTGVRRALRDPRCVV